MLRDLERPEGDGRGYILVMNMKCVYEILRHWHTAHGTRLAGQHLGITWQALSNGFRRLYDRSMVGKHD